MKKRTLSLFLALLILASAITSCSEKPEEQTETTGDTAPTSDSGDTAPVEESETELQPDLPEINFEDRTFTFLTSGVNDTNGKDWQTYDVWVEATNAEVINDAVFERNLYIEETYGAKIAEFKTTGATLDEIKKEVQADSGAFDAAMTHFENAANLSKDGFLHNLYSIDYLDMSKPWWDQRAVEELTILNGLYVATGDITVIDNDATWVLMFNKQMVDDYQLGNIYDLVREDKWYYDTLYDMMSKGSKDLDGDGKLNYRRDQFGFLTTAASAYGLLFAAGDAVVVRDNDAVLVPVSNIERLVGVVEKATAMMSDRNIVYREEFDAAGTDYLRSIFEEGRALFYGEVMQCIKRMRNSETDFGLVPWPKYDEGQERFYNWIHSSAGRGVVVPANKNDFEFIGVVLEAMAAKSLYTLTPAYYDISMTYKFMRDADSSEMLDIILDSRFYDLSLIYNFGMSSTITSMITSGSNTFASTWKAMSKSFGKNIEKTVKKFTKLEDERG